MPSGMPDEKEDCLFQTNRFPRNSHFEKSNCFFTLHLESDSDLGPPCVLHGPAESDFVCFVDSSIKCFWFSHACTEHCCCELSLGRYLQTPACISTGPFRDTTSPGSIPRPQGRVLCATVHCLGSWQGATVQSSLFYTRKLSA